MSNEHDNTLVPVDQRDIDFYGDVITAVMVEVDGRQVVYVPVRPICDYLGVSWQGQNRRLNDDEVLSAVSMSVNITLTDIEPDSRRPKTSRMLCLPLEFINGFLFGINPKRVKPEMKANIIRYQSECYRVLADAFLTPGTTVQPVEASDEPLVQLHNMALVIAATTREMLATKYLAQSNAQRLDRAALVVQNLTRRITAVEQQVRAGKLTEEQAAEIKRRVNLIAQEMSKHEPGKSHYQVVYAALGDEVGVTSYKAIPLKAYETAVSFLDNWLLSLMQAGKEGTAETDG